MNADNGMARAQAQYDAQTPPEPVEREFEADISVRFWFTLNQLTFDEGAQDDQMKDWMREELMPQLRRAINREINPNGGGVRNPAWGGSEYPYIGAEYEIEELRS